MSRPLGVVTHADGYGRWHASVRVPLAELDRTKARRAARDAIRREIAEREAPQAIGMVWATCTGERYGPDFVMISYAEAEDAP
jgi:hypothetical protein